MFLFFNRFRDCPNGKFHRSEIRPARSENLWQASARCLTLQFCSVRSWYIACCRAVCPKAALICTATFLFPAIIAIFGWLRHRLQSKRFFSVKFMKLRLRRHTFLNIVACYFRKNRKAYLHTLDFFSIPLRMYPIKLSGAAERAKNFQPSGFACNYFAEMLHYIRTE